MWFRMREPFEKMWVNFADGRGRGFTLLTDEEPQRTIKLVWIGDGRWAGEAEVGPPIPFDDPPLESAIEERFRSEMVAVDVQRAFRCPQCRARLRCAKCDAALVEWRAMKIKGAVA